uniref:Uncharacterized protein n=1 Tax=Ovis aries TaxID=9940 RepID=A0AC11DCH6_SHEEP
MKFLMASVFLRICLPGLNAMMSRKHWNCSFTERPREYLISILERLRIAKLSGVALPFFMDNSNIASMFEMLDSSNKGSISFVQYKEALKTLGLYTEGEVLKDDGHGVTFEQFRNEVNKRTQEIWSAF